MYDRTWNFSFDNAFSETSWRESLNRFLWSFGSLLTGGTLNAFAGSTGKWTLVGSSDGVTAGHDATDRLHFAGSYTSADWVANGPGFAHSWYVLQSPVTMNGYSFYMLVSLNSAANWSLITVMMSKVAFTGGTTLDNPTSTDQWNFGKTSTVSIIDGTVIATWRHNMCLSTTGDFIFFSTRAGTPISQGSYTYWSVMAPVGVHADDLYPVWNCGMSFPTTDLFCSSGQLSTRNAFGLLSYSIMPYQTRWYTDATLPDIFTGAWPDMPAWVFVQPDSSPWHARGRLPDILLQSLSLGNQIHAPGLTIRDGGGVIRYVTCGSIAIPANAAPNFT